MRRSVRAALVAALMLLLGWFAAGNFASKEIRADSLWLPESALRLGLDLRGGVHVVLGPKLEEAAGHELRQLKSALSERFEDRELGGVELTVEPGVLRLTPAAADVEKLREELDNRRTLDPQAVDVSERGGVFLLTLTPEQEELVRDRAMQQVLEVLRRRIDDPQTGIPESVVTRQGADRVLVQIPDVDRVPTDLIESTGRLEFKIVRSSAGNEELLRAQFPDGIEPGLEIVFEYDRAFEDSGDERRVLNAYLVPAEPDITGDYLENAASGLNTLRNEWFVSFTWSSEGAAIFTELTEKHLNEALAIILDGEVYSAPVIRSRIGRQGEITGNFTSQQASDLAVILRAGSLPIGIQIEEERTIGPALGQDSIERGLRASLAGLLLVMLFIMGYYRFSGGYASLALLCNLVLVLGLMSLFEGTLTLPGIAGLVLTVGMAVDANVIIFERIREELREGRGPRAAIAAGFQKARWTILDANITTLITAVILFQFGTGPIKGFAVTLSVGILASVFAALVITRLFYSFWPGDSEAARLSI